MDQDEEQKNNQNQYRGPYNDDNDSVSSDGNESSSQSYDSSQDDEQKSEQQHQMKQNIQSMEGNLGGNYCDQNQSQQQHNFKQSERIKQKLELNKGRSEYDSEYITDFKNFNQTIQEGLSTQQDNIHTQQGNETLNQQHSSLLQPNQKERKVQKRATNVPEPVSALFQNYAKIANCHMCKMKNKFVYGCYKHYTATSCNKMFCIDCLMHGFNENIILIVQNAMEWKCPYKRKICKCKGCTNSGQDYILPEYFSRAQIHRFFGDIVLDKDETNIQNNQNIQNINKNDQNKPEESTYMQRYQIKQKINSLLEFNGKLIQKLSQTTKKLNEKEIVFYNKLIHENLSVLTNLSNKLMKQKAYLKE